MHKEKRGLEGKLVIGWDDTEIGEWISPGFALDLKQNGKIKVLKTYSSA